jgi:zinc transporter ZupT
MGQRNVYNVSSATLTSYTSYSDGDSLDVSLPNHLGLPVKQKPKRKNTLGNLAREKKILSSIRNFLIVLALSIHSVFEGMAIGNNNFNHQSND